MFGRPRRTDARLRRRCAPGRPARPRLYNSGCRGTTSNIPPPRRRPLHYALTFRARLGTAGQGESVSALPSRIGALVRDRAVQPPQIHESSTSHVCNRNNETVQSVAAARRFHRSVSKMYAVEPKAWSTHCAHLRQRQGRPLGVDRLPCSSLAQFSGSSHLSSASNSASSCHFRVAPLRLSCPPPTDLGLHVSSVRRSVSLPHVAEFIVPVPTAGRLVFWRRVLSGRWLERDFVALCRVTSGLTLSRAPPRPAIFVFARLQRQLSRAVRL